MSDTRLAGMMPPRQVAPTAAGAHAGFRAQTLENFDPTGVSDLSGKGPKGSFCISNAQARARGTDRCATTA